LTTRKTGPPPAAALGTDLHGLSRLAIDAVLGVTGLVEAMHRNISAPAGVLGPAPSGPTRGITGLVYRSVGGITRAVGWGLDATLPRLAPLLGPAAHAPRRDAMLAALNGVLGDHLAETGNPLAITMALRQGGQPLTLERAALAAALTGAGGKLLVLVHGLCMNDLQWQRQGHDHGAALARDLGVVPLYLHYNSGRHVSTNGHDLAQLLEHLLHEWPVPVRELALVGHSMGGLVCRSACRSAAQAGHTWPRRLRAMVFMGTPHHGAPLERAGSSVDTLLDLSPYTAPFGRIGRIRSAGIQDLRHGRLCDEDWQPPRSRTRTPVPLPEGVRCHVMAATKQAADAPRRRGSRLPGDGLVPVASALGDHADPALRLQVPPERQWVGHGLNHFDLLSSEAAYDQLKRWLGPQGRRKAL
jgi:hypothetical protein